MGKEKDDSRLTKQSVYGMLNTEQNDSIAASALHKESKMTRNQLAVAAVSTSFRKGNIVSFQYNGKNRVVVVDNVFDNRIIGKDKEGFKSYRFDRMQNQPILTVIS